MRLIKHGGDIYTKNTIKNLIDFSANINPLGMPKGISNAIIENIDQYMCYPDCQCTDLRNAIANLLNINPNMITCGNGAADIIYRIALALRPKKALILAPTFSEYEDALKLVDTEINYYYLHEENNFEIQSDITEFITKDLDIIFLCNPNNPTGIPYCKHEMMKIIQKCKSEDVILVVDECFSDFLMDEENYSVVSEISKYDNLIILKAFTKMYAMAGIRLGYMLCSNENFNFAISNMLQPWSVSTVASKCGIAATKEKDFVIKTREYISNNRKYLIDNLRELGYKVFDSKVNYILFKSNDTEINKKLEKYGILIRSCSNYVNLGKNFFRIAVRSTDDNKRIIECLKLVTGVD